MIGNKKSSCKKGWREISYYSEAIKYFGGGLC